jgi:hypothetical protein
MAVSQCSSIIWSATGRTGQRRGHHPEYDRCASHSDGELNMASKPTTRITKEMQQIITEMIARMSLRG